MATYVFGFSERRDSGGIQRNVPAQHIGLAGCAAALCTAATTATVRCQKAYIHSPDVRVSSESVNMCMVCPRST